MDNSLLYDLQFVVSESFTSTKFYVYWFCDSRMALSIFAEMDITHLCYFEIAPLFLVVCVSFKAEVGIYINAFKENFIVVESVIVFCFLIANTAWDLKVPILLVLCFRLLLLKHPPCLIWGKVNQNHFTASNTRMFFFFFYSTFVCKY